MVLSRFSRLVVWSDLIDPFDLNLEPSAAFRDLGESIDLNAEVGAILMSTVGSLLRFKDGSSMEFGPADVWHLEGEWSTTEDGLDPAEALNQPPSTAVNGNRFTLAQSFRCV